MRIAATSQAARDKELLKPPERPPKGGQQGPGPGGDAGRAVEASREE